MNLIVKTKSLFHFGSVEVLILLVIFLFVFIGDSTAYAKKNDLQIGQAGKIKSKVLSEEFKLFVHLPDDYRNSSKRYPVLYHFYDEGLIFLFHYSTGVTRFLSSNNIIPPMIVVSVQVNGVRDLTPTRAPNYGPNSGGADKYIKFLKEELVPYIEKTYRTNSYRIVWGHSIVGNFCIYSLLSSPELFNAYITSSPFLIYDGYDAFILKNAKKYLESRKGEENFLYITVGNEPHLGPVIDQFVKLLKTMNPKGLKWEYRVNKEENHNSNQSLCLEEGLRYLYSHK